MVSLKEFQNEFSLIELIKSGSFGSVYEARDKKGQHYAVKILTKPVVKAKKHFLFLRSTKPMKEGKILSKLQGIVGIPKLYFYGENPYINSHMLITEFLGDDLRTNFENKKKFAPGFITRIGCKMIDILESIHEKNIIHCDIKPDNILLSPSNNERGEIYLIDFGLSRFHEKKNIKSKEKFYGSLFFAAIDCHDYKKPEKKHDLESLGYLVLYFIQGRLAWQNNEKIGDFSEMIVSVGKRKKEFIQQELESIPSSLRNFFQYIQDLNSFEKIDYKYLKQLMLKLNNELMYQKEKNISLNTTFQNTTIKNSSNTSDVSCEEEERQMSCNYLPSSRENINEKMSKLEDLKK